MAASPPTSPPTSPTSPAPPSPPFRFLDLPLELREQIYSLYFRPADRLLKSVELESKGFAGGVYKFDLRLQRVCKQVARESRRVWGREVRAVKVATPWVSAVNHISSEGLVPIICTDPRAVHFSSHHAVISITAPFHETVPEYTVVLLLRDLPLFTQTWYYSALSYPMLNDRLQTSFLLRDPDMDEIDEDDEKNIPLPLQREILSPFGTIKGLYGIEVTGFHKSVEKDLRATMAIPPPTLQQSCETATRLLSEGDSYLSLGPAGAEQALASYTAAFHAIHILIHNRTRRVLADTFFHATIPAGIYAGHTGMTVRVILRLRLVARVMHAHLLLSNWGEAAFWGMRSVRIMSEAMDTEFEDFLAELVGGDDVGLVFVRAGIALWKMGVEREKWEGELKAYEGDEMADVGRLLGGSLKHLKRGRGRVRKEVEAYGLPRRFVGVFDETAGSEAGSEAGSVTVNVDPEEVQGGGWA